jgi:protein tyrosine phosphatase (PTP) superfamily phosphohydrolase (DUF442 family)
VQFASLSDAIKRAEKHTRINVDEISVAPQHVINDIESILQLGTYGVAARGSDDSVRSKSTLKSPTITREAALNSRCVLDGNHTPIQKLNR